MADPCAPARPVGKYERLSRERHERDLALAAQPGGHPRGLWFDEAAADRAVAFIEGFCKHHKGEWAGRPLILEEWQKRDVVRPIFGWRRADGTRRYRTAYVEIPRKNGKSELAAAIALYLLVADDEAGAEVYASATKRDQAKIVADTAAAMVKASPDLRRFIKVFRNNLVCDRLGSKLEPLGADSNTLDGLNPHGNIVDELHAHKDPRVWAVLDTAMGARRQPLTLAITTAGVYAEESIGWQQHDHARKVLEGVIEDEAYFAFIAASDDGDDQFGAEAQQKANPNYGVSIKPDYLARQAKKAQESPSFLNEYLRLHLNVWTQQITRWLSVERWNECDGTPLTVESLAGRECFGGLDLSSKLDLCALVLAFPGDDDILDLLCRFWIPEDTISEHTRKGRGFYRQWADEGWLTQTPGNIVDYDFIRSEVNELGSRVQLRELAFDPWNSSQISVNLMADGYQLVETRQGYKTLSEPSKDFEARVVSRKVRHGGNPVLRWCVANAVIARDSAGNIKPDKEKASDKIDGVVAAIMALSRLIVHKDDSSPYTPERGLMAF